MKTFGLFQEDAGAKNQWKMSVDGKPANRGLPVKWRLKRVI